jgi:PAS domain S-box-containing protein
MRPLPFILAATAFLLRVAPAFAQTPPPVPPTWVGPDEPRIVIVNSYHYGFWWSDEEQRGVIEGLRERWPTLQPAVEYLDLKRFPNLENETNFVAYALQKYRHTRFDLSIFLDDAGLKAAENHPYLVENSPIVFCGVANRPERRYSSFTNVTGIVEEPDVGGNLRLILQLLPDVQEIHVATSRSNAAALRYHAGQVLGDGPVQLKQVPRLSMEKLLDYASALPPGSVLVELALQADGERRLIPPEFRQELTRRCPVPLFVHYDTGRGVGLGGRVLSAYEHGRQAARLAMRVLDGEPAASIPPVIGGPEVRTVIDYEQLIRFGIPESRVPPDAHVINRPPSILSRYRRGLYALGGFVIGLTVLSLLLIRANARRRQLFNQASDAIFVMNLDSVITDVNHAACAMLGYERESLVGRRYTELVEPDNLNSAPFSADRLEPGKAIHLRRRLLRKDGTVVIGDCSMSRLGGDQIQKIIRDATQREQAEQALRDNEERFRSVAEAVEEIIYEWHPDTDAVWRSDPVVDFLGYPETEVEATGAWWLRQVHPDDAAAVQQKFRDALAGRDSFSFEYRMRHKDGSAIHVWDKGRIFRDASGNVSKVIGGANNLTERRHLEAQLRQAQKMEAIGTLAGGIAHDFNNILSGVLGNAELARMDLPKDHKVQICVDEILRATERARNLINQILTFSRRSDEPNLVVNLGLTVREAYRLLRSTSPLSVDVVLDSEPELPPVEADPTQIYQALMNLATNAWQAFESAPGRIDIVVRGVSLDGDEACAIGSLPAGRYLRIQVRDNGPGMSALVKERIFEPFFTTKGLGRGTGLGLAVVHGIVHGHRGEITVESEPGKGTEFAIYLPVASRPAKPEPGGVKPPPAGDGRRILMVDDEEMLLRTGSEILRHLGYRVETRQNPETARVLFAESPGRWDAVMTDLSMPTMTGVELADHLRRIRPDVPIVLMSGYLGEMDIADYVRQGFRDVLQKPLGVEQLGHSLGRIFGPAD